MLLCLKMNDNIKTIVTFPSSILFHLVHYVVSAKSCTSTVECYHNNIEIATGNIPSRPIGVIGVCRVLISRPCKMKLVAEATFLLFCIFVVVTKMCSILAVSLGNIVEFVNATEM